jgi:hypothetical protein
MRTLILFVAVMLPLLADAPAPVDLTVVVSQVLPNGLLCEKQDVTMTTINLPGKGGVFVPNVTDSGIVVFVQANPSGYAEGDNKTFHAVRQGVYQFTDTTGTKRTVQKWVEVAATVPAPTPVPTPTPAPWNPGSINDPIRQQSACF